MKVTPCALPDLLVLEAQVHTDSRGYLLESYNQRALREAAGIDAAFVQENHSRSARNVLRGLHYQLQHPQGKLIRVVAGEVFDVAVDLRRSSPSFGRWAGQRLSSENMRMLWVPPGFAHGFLALSDFADVSYKTTTYYEPALERCLRWDDPQVGIEWPLSGAPLLSEKDRRGVALVMAEVFS